jgi:lipopolysaccharide assembly outer membrane protein LptD (OstA)
MNPIQVLIQHNSNQYNYGSAEIYYDLKNLFDLNAKYDYDFNFSTTSKFEFNADYKQLDNLKLNLYYNYRQPRINYNSIFSVFDYGNSQELEFGADYTINKHLTLTGKVGDVIYKDDNSQRVTVGLNTTLGSLTYLKNLGYSGEMDAISLYAAHSFFTGLITPSLGVSYTSYKLSRDAEKNNLTSFLAGVNVRPYRTLSFDLQGQYMDNKIYKNDFRFFLKLNYWFNHNFM